MSPAKLSLLKPILHVYLASCARWEYASKTRPTRRVTSGACEDLVKSASNSQHIDIFLSLDHSIVPRPISLRLLSIQPQQPPHPQAHLIMVNLISVALCLPLTVKLEGFLVWLAVSSEKPRNRPPPRLLCPPQHRSHPSLHEWPTIFRLPHRHRPACPLHRVQRNL